VTDVGVGHNSSPRDNISPAERGYRFQRVLTLRILERLRRFRSVTAKKMDGNLMTPETFALGRDGGMDMVLEIEGKSKKSALQTASRVKKALKSIVE
jgi:hypothetical protein